MTEYADEITKRNHNYLQLGNHLVALLQQCSGVIDKLVNNSLGGLLFIDNSGNLTHQIRTGVVESVIINIIGQVLEVVLHRDNTLGSELLDLLGTVLLPVQDVGVLADTQGTTLENLSVPK